MHAHAGVEVVLPARAPERAAAAAVRELRPWIERRLGEAREALARVAARAGTLPYLDDVADARAASQGARACTATASVCSCPSATPRAAIERFYRRAARAEIAPRLDRATALAGTPYRDLVDPRAAHALGLVLGQPAA